MAKKKKQENILFILMGIIILGLMVAGFFLFKQQINDIVVKQKQQTAAQEALVEQQKQIGKEPQEKSEEYIPQEDVQIIQVYYGVKGKDKIESESKRVRKSKMLITQARQVANSLLETPNNERLYKLLPEGTTLRGLFYDSGVYTIDFSREFNAVFNYGPAEQLLTMYSIVNSITELDPEAKIRFLVNGTEVEGEEGHIDVTAHLTRLESIIEK